MKKWLLWIGVLVIIAGGAAWHLTRSKSKTQSVSTSIMTVEQGPIEVAVDATGVVEPLNRVEIKPPISGRVEQLIAVEGEKVTAGQVLAWMSSSDRAAILDAARGVSQ